VGDEDLQCQTLVVRRPRHRSRPSHGAAIANGANEARVSKRHPEARAFWRASKDARQGAGPVSFEARIRSRLRMTGDITARSVILEVRAHPSRPSDHEAIANGAIEGAQLRRTLRDALLTQRSSG
jgi:hypothetical protein